MTREKLLKNPEYWITDFQAGLFGVIEQYMKKNKFTRTDLAEQLNVSKGYISQVLNGDFDHKVSKLVELALASGKVPFLRFIDMDEYIKNDSSNMVYEVVCDYRTQVVGFTPKKMYNNYSEVFEVGKTG